MTRSELEALAASLEVGAPALEKVVRLLDILARFESDEELADRYALKGGTALNLYLLEMPRLSVDIDINFIRNCTPAELVEMRPEFLARVERSAQLAGCRALHAPDEYAGGKYRLRYMSAFGGEQNLELDVSFVGRVPVLGLIRREVAVKHLPGPEVTTYTLEELAAGKFAALVSRTAARDNYDAYRLLQERPGLLEDPGFRAAFLVFVAGASNDIRLRPRRVSPLSANDVRHQLIPLLRQSTGAGPLDPASLARDLDAIVAPSVAVLLDFSMREREFLGALMDRGELLPHLLTDDPDLQARVAVQPMLRWKQLHVRKHLGLAPIN